MADLATLRQLLNQDEDLRREPVRMVAHGLSGIAGSFGHSSLGALASDIDDEITKRQVVAEEKLRKLAAALEQAIGDAGARQDGEERRDGVQGYALIIEDDLLMADVLARHLEMLGYRPVSIVSTAADALAAIEGREPALILADICLADGESGLEIAQAIHRNHHVPLVFVSARPELAAESPRTTVLDKSKLSLAALRTVIERARRTWYLE